MSNATLVYTGGSTDIDRGMTVGGTAAVNVSNAATTLGIGGSIIGTGALRKDGAGTLVLSGNNTFIGGLVVNGGIVRAGSTTALGARAVTMTNAAGVMLDLAGFDSAIAVLNGGGAAGGNVTLGAATLTLNWGVGGASFAGAISGSGGLVKTGAFTQALTGCGSSYTGSTAVSGGILQVLCLTDGGTNSAIGASSNAAGNLIISGGTLQYVGTGGSTDRLFTLGASASSRLEASGTGAIAFTGTGPIAFVTPGTAQTLALGGTNTGNNSLAAQITNNGAGVTSLTKDGAGTWILNNPNSSYTGVTTINGGVLGVDKLSNGGVASSIGASSAAAANLVIGNASTLRYTGSGDTTNRLFTLSAGTTFIESSGTGAVVFTDTGPVTLAGNNQARTIALGGTNTGNNTLAGAIGNAGTGVTVLAKNDAGTWLLTGNNSYTGNTNINAGTLILGNGGTTGSIASATVNNLGVFGFNRSDTLTLASTIGGTGSVQQIGAGTTILTGNSNYSGGTTISAGTLQLGNGGTTGSITGNVTDNGALTFNRGDTLTFAGVISGTGTVNQIGAGTLVLSGTNSYGGGTLITGGGTLQVSSDANLGNAAGGITFDNGTLHSTASFTSNRVVTLTGDGTVDADNLVSWTLAGNVTGAGSLTKIGAGTLVLTGDATHGGGTTVSAGTLQVGSGTSGSIAGDIVDNGALVFGRSNAYAYAGLVSGTGTLTQSGAGVLTLSGNNSYTGATNVNGGTLRINGDQSAATGLVTVANGATLGGGGTIGGSVLVQNGGTIAPGNSPGTLTIAGNLTLSASSISNFEFGQANVAGGPLNDLVNVGGNLTLDGTINVNLSAGGTFGGGIYRVYNYGGTLTNNGLVVGTVPAGANAIVQTSVAGQVNLVNTTGLTLNFWDGTGPKFDSVVSGGSGTWQNSTGNNNWTDATGGINAPYADGAMAIFQGAPGTVTVDNSVGQVTASGMQFASSGYVITGQNIAMVGPQSTIRVGDGTAAGAGFTATVAAALGGASQLVKTDLGTLVLTGANTYTGGTAINGGTLSVSTDANLGGAGGALSFNGGVLRWTGGILTNARAINWGANGGGFDITNVTTFVVTQALASGGALTKSGAGILALSGDNTYTGGTTIAGGTLRLGTGGTTGSILGDVVNNGTLSFSRSDAWTFGGSITGTGAVTSIAGGITTLTGNSNYGGATDVSGGGGLRILGATVTSGGSSLVSGSSLTVDSGGVFNVAAIGAQSSPGIGSAVNVRNGGVLNTTGDLTLRNSPTNVVLSTLNVSGAGSLANVGGGVSLAASNASNINGVNITGGGKLTTGAASTMGAAAGNTTAPFVTIDGAGSDWTSQSGLTITNGNFSLLNGGTASFTTAVIGTVSAVRQGSATVSGTGSQLTTTGDLIVGSGAGTGALTLADGGRVNVGGAFVLANATTATGILNIGGAEGQAAAATGVFDAATLNLGSATSRVNFNHTDPAYVFATVMSGAGAVNQVAGTTTLTGANSYSDLTAVWGGTLLINGDQTAATGATTVVGGTLGGTGIIGGNVLVADGATLAPGDATGPGTLTINGNLGLSGGSRLVYDFGQSNIVGGPLNDLTQVGGDLTLAGTIDVTVSPGGSFDAGLYRVISYGGTLTDNGLTPGVMPAGSSALVQTSVAGQVNLVNSAGLTLNFWDGAAGPRLNGRVDGGDGIWQASTGNDNWSDITGVFNAGFSDGAFAIFSAAPGTVTVDNGLGTISAAGMQFASDGYVITGQDLTLVGPQSVIRVGDGTAAGLGYTATIDAALTGNTQLVKTDLGTLVLGGTNSYTGGTRINVGTLSISSDANLGDAAGGLSFDGGTLHSTADITSDRNVDMIGKGIFLTDAGTTLVFTGSVTGSGDLIKDGTGNLALNDTSTHTGLTTVRAGSLFVNGDQSAATGLTSVALGATLGGHGIIGGDVVVADGGTLAPGNSPGTLTINGSLSLTSGSLLNFEFGEANVAGGALNDLVNIGGDLTLDGTINVSVSAGGSFGPGIYRVFNYGGALTDNGLALGTLPGGSAVFVQTAIAGQINLVNTAGLTLSFWDGAAGPKNDAIVNGGNGVWQVGSGSNNWTTASGSPNADYAQDSFAIFSAAPGTVTVDNSGGAVRASGMQFASDGYVIASGPLTLTGAQAIVQVGDGSAAGAGYTATIASELTGTAGLVKTDLGTLVLTGVNSYTGGTAINSGSLQIGNGGATGSITGDIANNGTLAVNRTDTLTLDGAISGTGSLTKLGSGTLVLGGTNSYAGGTTIGGGTVQVSSDANLGDVAGTLSLQGGTLQAGASFTSARGLLLGSPNSNNIDTQGFDVTLAGTIGDGPNNSAGNFVNKLGTGTLTLTGANSYSNRTVIAGGTLALAGAGTIGSGNLVVGAGTVFDISQTNTGARVIQLNSGPAGTIALGSRVLTLGLGNSFSDWSGTITDGGIAGGTGGSVVIAAPNGAVRFFEANSYTGGTTVAGGTFVLAGNGSLYSGGAVAVNGGAVFDISGLTGAGTTIGDLSGAGTVSLGGKSLTFGTANSTAVSGTITGAGGALVKNGTGTFTLSGANSYTGATNVTAGTLLVNGNQSAATGLTSIASGATLGGTGIIGGDVVVADGGTLAPGAGGAGTLTINGGLALSGASTLAWEFGAANAVGSPLNDVVNVGGDLTLDGTINVAVTPGGAFGIGLYRIANYGGALIDNGLAIGTMPAGADVFVQTAVANQVNLINTGGATLNFWDGSAGANKFNNAVDGGGGMWRTGLDNSWTEATGAVNAAYANGAFAIFAGTGGLVTIDNSLGTVTASGLQFATTNYRIQGGPLTLTGPQSVIRVGDGTSAGLGYSAIITSEITGNTQLVKTDLGRLELAGTNSYTGGTALNGGTIRVASDANLGAASGGLSFNGGTLNTTADISTARAVTLAGQGVFSVDTGTTLTLSGSLTGTGLIGKLDSGTLVLAGTGSHTGGMGIVQGTLLVNGNYAAATGPMTISQIATLGGTGTIGGNVNLNGTLASGANGVGTLTINGDLLISQSATLAYEFGQANVAGGTLNDLVNVGGDLTLDGTINVTVPTGGSFGAGIYRVFNYAGALTDNGLTLGALPAGSNVAVQTSVVGQVNLVNSAGLTLSFWDGVAGPKNNGTINGGNGVWQNGTGNDNWTDATGAVNAAYSDGAFAVFGGSGGTVTVDNGLGQVSAAGMQFAANGYTIIGSTVALTGPQSTLRVGDGSAAGAGFTATINAVLSGDTQLVKTDAGTLVLGGTNSYTGGTLINGGTVRIAADANLGAAAGNVTLDGGTLASSATLNSGRGVVMAGAGTISTADATIFTLGGALTGTGALTKAGAGTLLMTGNNSGYTGATTVSAGTLAVTGTFGGAVSVAGGSRLEGTGTVGSVTNAGVVAPGRDGFGTLTTAGYTGSGGHLEIETALGGDGSQTDLLTVNGATAGTTAIDLVNRGGLGGQTTNGIKIVDVTGASNGVFTLNGDYVFEGDQAVIAGAYGYRLYKNGVSTPADGDWYLRSALLNPIQPNEPQVPLYQPGVPVYEAYGQTLLTLADVGTMQQRIGNRQWAGTGSGKASGIWGRMQSSRSRPNAAFSTSFSDVNVDSWKLELGADHVLSERGDGASLVLGVLGGYGEANADIASIYGNGSIKAKGYSAGATLTWFGPQGFYVDSRAQLTWFDSKLKSAVLGTLADGNNGTGQAYSVEVGKRATIGQTLSVTPQIQMVYSTVGFDRFTDPNGAVVSSKLGDSLKTRWGISLDRQDTKSRLYGVANLSYEWLDGTVTDVSGTPIARENHRLWGELGAGGSVLLGDRLTLYTEASANTAVNDFGKSYSLKGTAGLRLAF